MNRILFIIFLSISITFYFSLLFHYSSSNFLFSSPISPPVLTLFLLSFLLTIRSSSPSLPIPRFPHFLPFPFVLFYLHSPRLLFSIIIILMPLKRSCFPHFFLCSSSSSISSAFVSSFALQPLFLPTVYIKFQ